MMIVTMYILLACVIALSVGVLFQAHDARKMDRYTKDIFIEIMKSTAQLEHQVKYLVLSQKIEANQHFGNFGDIHVTTKRSHDTVTASSPDTVTLDYGDVDRTLSTPRATQLPSDTDSNTGLGEDAHRPNDGR